MSDNRDRRARPCLTVTILQNMINIIKRVEYYSVYNKSIKNILEIIKHMYSRDHFKFLVYSSVGI